MHQNHRYDQNVEDQLVNERTSRNLLSSTAQFTLNIISKQSRREACRGVSPKNAVCILFVMDSLT